MTIIKRQVNRAFIKALPPHMDRAELTIQRYGVVEKSPRNGT